MGPGPYLDRASRHRREREPLDEDPGAVKEMTVKLALALDPPGMLPVIIRFVRSGAHVSARMKAVRDLCGGITRPEVREVMEWVVAEDPWLRDRAAQCLEGAAERHSASSWISSGANARP
jgi:hypothetical protein